MLGYKMIGLMSGTSLDGVDLCCANFKQSESSNWNYEILATKTYDLPQEIKQDIQKGKEASALSFQELDISLADFFSDCILNFLKEFKLDAKEITAIASHGQTIFHQPDRGFTTQIADPGRISVRTNIPVIGDFRSKDVHYGGQGAPLVPMGDKHLFLSKADACVNIGGFSNLSFIKDKKVIAFDVCPGNLPMNVLMQTLGKNYDEDGNLAKTGEVNFYLLDMLNNLPFYKKHAPKSLGTEWLEQSFLPLVKKDKDLADNLCTIAEHIAIQIAEVLNTEQLMSAMITGGGAKNSYLMSRIAHYYKGKILLADEQLIDFKEALIFAFLGVLRLREEPNCLASVTGASKDVCGGVIFYP